jgi:outer membrane protein TolC
MRSYIPLCVLFSVSAYAQAVGPAAAGAQAAAAQTPVAQPATAPRAPLQFSGSAPTGVATNAVIDLTLSDAVSRALKYNLALIEGGQDVRLTRAERLQALSQILPSINARPSVTEQQVNLAAFGFSGFPGIPSVVGPFKVVDARAFFTETIGFAGFRAWQSRQHAVRASELSLRDARDEVVLVVVQLYLQAVARSARIEAARAQVQTAQELFRTASDQRAAGVAPAIDVLRAQVELQSRQQQQIFYEGEFEKEKLALARAIGLPTGQTFRLAETVPYTPLPGAVDLNAAISDAYRQRADFQAAEASVRAAELALSSARAERYPSGAINADYGANGLHFDQLHGSFTVSAGVNIPIIQSGRIRAAIELASAQLEQRRAERDNLRGQIDADVRNAFIDLQSASRQVEVARSNVDLATQTVTQSRDRFAAGVTNNLEVVQAQEALATANDNYISALYAFNSAKAALARARGVSEEEITKAVTGK